MDPNTKKALLGAGVAVLVIAGMVVIINQQTPGEKVQTEAAAQPEQGNRTNKEESTAANTQEKVPSLQDLLVRANRPVDGKKNLTAEELKDVVLVYSIDLKLAADVNAAAQKDTLPKFIRISTANGKTVEELFTQMPAEGVKPLQSSLSTPPPCLPLEHRYSILTYVGTETIDEKVYDVLKGTNDGIQTASKLYLDRENGRLARSTEPGVIQYSDYQTIDGITLPAVMTAEVDKTIMNFKLVSAEVNKGIKDTRFTDAAKNVTSPAETTAPATEVNASATSTEKDPASLTPEKKPEAAADSNVFMVRHYDLLDQYTVRNGETMMPLFHLAGFESVKDFQTANQLKADGIVGPQTLNVLRQKLGDKKVDPIAKRLPNIKQPVSFAFARNNNDLQLTITNNTAKTINLTTPLRVNIAPIGPNASLDYVPATGQVVQLVPIKQPILAGKSVTVTVKKGTASKHWAGKVKGIFLFDEAYTYRP